jgi:MFS family permease
VTTVEPWGAGYREVLRDREYRAIFLADGLSVVGDQVTRLAVALLVFDRTGSALAAAATYACSFLSWLVGGPVLSALADRLPRRRLMISCDVARALLVLILVVPGLPLAVIFAVLVSVGLLAPPFDAARSALLADVLEGDRYVVGNALSGAVGQAGQVVGFVMGGALVALIGTQGALLVDASTFLLSALLLGTGVRERPVAGGGSAAGLQSELSAGLRLVLGTSQLRVLLGWGVLIAAMTIAPEGLAVTVADGMGGGAAAAGVLTAAVPAGFLLGSWLVLRLPPSRRRTLFPWLTVLSGVALATTPWLNSLWLIAAIWTLAGIGTALQLVANAAFVQAVPAHVRGRAFGVAGTVLMATQGLVLLAGGALADRIGAQTTVAVLAVGGLGVLALCAAGARLPLTQVSGRTVRGA